MTKCPNCGCKITKEMADANMCWECGYILDSSLIDDSQPVVYTVKEQRVEKEKKEYALSKGEFYEYDVETSISKEGGMINTTEIVEILNQRARDGWRLHTMYSNTLGVNAMRILGIGTNETISQATMIFERKIESNDNR
jgi:transcription initiation factor TFIIIB Brf1 subunit/transcription initiation factor TFIIB